MQARVEAAIERVKADIAKAKATQMAFETQLLDPELVFQAIGFSNFLSAWLIRQADPKHTHPNPPTE